MGQGSLSISPDPPPGSGGAVTVAGDECPAHHSVVARLVLNDARVLSVRSTTSDAHDTWAVVVTFPPASTLNHGDTLTIEAACGRLFTYDPVVIVDLDGRSPGHASHAEHGHAAHATVASANFAG